MTNWAGIVYGRTYELDFRPLALPQDCTKAEQDWIMVHLQTMTRYAERLPNRPRWAVFKQGNLCVVAIACMARELVTEDVSMEMDLTRDHRGRPLFTAVGYAARLVQGERVQIPTYLDRDIRVFRPLYQEYVLPHWKATSYLKDLTTLTDYRAVSFDRAVSEPSQGSVQLNLAESDYTLLWSNDLAVPLWTSASASLADGQDVSLCLSLPDQSSAVNGAFLNATADGVAQKQKIVRLPESVPNLASMAPNQSVSESPQSVVSRRRMLITALMLLTGISLGGMTGVLFAKSRVRLQMIARSNVEPPKKFANFGIVGALLGGLSTVSIAVLLFRKIPSSGLRRRQEKPARKDEIAPSGVDPMMGFREKPQQDKSQEDDFMTWR